MAFRISIVAAPHEVSSGAAPVDVVVAHVETFVQWRARANSFGG